MNIKYHLIGNKNNVFDSKKELIQYYDWQAYKVDENHISEIDVDSEDYMLRDIPDEFRPAMVYMAYKLGHSYGESEIRYHLSELVDDFENPIRNFERKIRDQYID